MTRAPSADFVMDHLLQEAAREFPGWSFERDRSGWTATRDQTRLRRPSLAALRAILRLHRAVRHDSTRPDSTRHDGARLEGARLEGARLEGARRDSERPRV
ncbi:hypothetical protein WBK31_30860 [Nonomuraea sp. N2-4H]|uniref:hypothetical protein n=1 Tax=Nonomuraea sp. N2-4H TaxID=3128898 RepID=UPI0032558758